jgi:hypothetical protein
MDGVTLVLGFTAGLVMGSLLTWVYLLRSLIKGTEIRAACKTILEKIKRKKSKERKDKLEKPRVRKAANGVWLKDNTTVFKGALETIVQIYQSGFEPFFEELTELEEKELEFLYRKGAFKTDEPEKQRVFLAILGKVKTNSDLLNFYYKWATSGRKEEISIAERIISSIKKWGTDDIKVTDIDLLKVTHEGLLYQFLELDKITLPDQNVHQPFIIKKLNPEKTKDKDKEEEEKTG